MKTSPRAPKPAKPGRSPLLWALPLLALLALAGPASGQQPAQGKYWVFFQGKDSTLLQGADYPFVSPKTLRQRQMLGLAARQYSDLPVPQSYLQALQARGVEPVVVSKWFNAATAYLSPDQARELRSLPFVKGTQPVAHRAQPAQTARPGSYFLSTSLEQFEAHAFLDRELNGRGVTIGVIDAGFYQAHKKASLAHLFEEDRILGQKDYVTKGRKDLIRQKKTNLDHHGTTVLHNIAGIEPKKESLYGLATEAKFYLARTDHGVREWRGEEDYWVAALEWMDSLGVRLINTSLGYALDHDDPDENYKPRQMDGHTSVVAKGAQKAINQKGMILVVAAGNEGDNPAWEIVATPADVEEVIAVGANQGGFWLKAGYSSIGPHFLDYRKPNVSAFSLFGTSFAAPAITGFAACLLQKDSTLTAAEMRRLLEKAGHLYPYANNYLGAGVPSGYRALALMNKPDTTFARSEKVRESGNKFRLKIPDGTQIRGGVVFHKSEEWQVQRQEKWIVPEKKGFFEWLFGSGKDDEEDEDYNSDVPFEELKDRVRFQRPEEAQRSTIHYPGRVVEVVWED